MSQPKSNIVLIGMPGSEKSTVGIVLAKLCLRDFIDTDVIIQSREGTKLQDIIDSMAGVKSALDSCLCGGG